MANPLTRLKRMFQGSVVRRTRPTVRPSAEKNFMTYDLTADTRY